MRAAQMDMEEGSSGEESDDDGDGTAVSGRPFAHPGAGFFALRAVC